MLRGKSWTIKVYEFRQVWKEAAVNRLYLCVFRIACSESFVDLWKSNSLAGGGRLPNHVVLILNLCERENVYGSSA